MSERRKAVVVRIAARDDAQEAVELARKMLLSRNRAKECLAALRSLLAFLQYASDSTSFSFDPASARAVRLPDELPSLLYEPLSHACIHSLSHSSNRLANISLDRFGALVEVHLSARLRACIAFIINSLPASLCNEESLGLEYAHRTITACAHCD